MRVRPPATAAGRAVAAVAALAFLACGDPTRPDPNAVTALEIVSDTPRDTIVETERRTLRVRGRTRAGAPAEVPGAAWASSDTGVLAAAPAADGTVAVEGVTVGRAAVAVTWEGLRAERALTVGRAQVAAVVVERAESPLPAPGLGLGEADTLFVRAARAYRAVALAPTGRPLRGRAAVLTSSDADVARVGADGRVEGGAVGNTTLSAVVEGMIGSRLLRVRPPLAAGVAFTYAPDSLLVRRTDSVRAVLLDSAGRPIAVPTALRVSTAGAAVAPGGVRGASAGTVELIASGDGLEVRRLLRIVAVPPAPPVAYPAAVVATPGRPLLLAARAVDIDGVTIEGPVTYASDDPAVATVSATGVVTALAPGATVVRVTAGALRTTVPVTVAGAPTFRVEVRPAGPPLADNVTAVLAEAAAVWERAIVGDLPDLTVSLTAGQCDQTFAGEVPVDDIVVFARVDSIDGRSGVLAQAGPCVVRADSRAAVGVVQIDSADVAPLLASGDLATVLRHELGHVLGIGTAWVRPGFAARSSGLWRYRGPRGLAVGAWWDRALAAPDAGVPLGGAFGSDPGHWSESAFDNELMTPFLNRGANPLSLITLEALADLGYETTAAAAEAYARYPGIPAAAPSASRLPEWGFGTPTVGAGVPFDAVRLPRWRVGAGGRATPL
jgi:hypothetical protein